MNANVLTVNVNGVTWTLVYKGSITSRYETRDGMLLASDVAAHGSQTLLDNGSRYSGGPLKLNTKPDRYTCFGNSLRILVPDGVSEVLTRNTHA